MGRSLAAFYAQPVSFPDNAQPEPVEINNSLLRQAKEAGYHYALDAELGPDAVFEAFLPCEEPVASSSPSSTPPNAHADASVDERHCPPDLQNPDARAPLSPSSGVFHSQTLNLPLEIPARRSASNSISLTAIRISPEEVVRRQEEIRRMLHAFTENRGSATRLPRRREPEVAAQ